MSGRSPMGAGERNYYSILQVDPQAEPEVISAAYRQLAGKYHPDKNSDPAIGARMTEINRAYDTLSDPMARAAYDEAIGVKRSPKSPSGMSGKSSGWENVPEETPAAPPQASPAPAAMSDVAAEIASVPDPHLITDGELLRAAEWYFPALWLGMLLVVCFIGVYSAVGKLPNSPW